MGMKFRGIYKYKRQVGNFVRTLHWLGFSSEKPETLNLHIHSFLSLSVHNICKGKVWKSVETPRLQILTKWEKTKRARRQTEANFQNFILGPWRNPFSSVVSCLQYQNKELQWTAVTWLTQIMATDHKKCPVVGPGAWWPPRVWCGPWPGCDGTRGPVVTTVAGENGY